MVPAAFGRLCVETMFPPFRQPETRPAAFGRLCVETLALNLPPEGALRQPPSGGCVLKQANQARHRLRANQPPSGGCVLKH